MMMWQLMKGVRYLHNRQVLHRDLTPKNLLFDPRTGTLQIAGFKLSRVVSAEEGCHSHEVRTGHGPVDESHLLPLMQAAQLS